MKNNTETTKNSALEKRRKQINANYTMAMTGLVLAFIIIINLMVGSLGTNIRQIDLTRGDVFSLTEESKEFIKGLEKDVTLYLILEDVTNRNDDLYKLLQVYDDASEHINIETINPATNPTFLDNREYVSEGSVMVECGERFKGVELAEMLISSEDSSTGNTYYFYDMEGMLTSAIDYVTSDSVPKAYIAKSGYTDVFDETLLKGIRKQNIDVELFEIEKSTDIPEDADIFILDQPAKDISDDLYASLDEFMNNGGSLMMIEYYNHTEASTLTNIEKLLDKYGISSGYGVAIETNTSYLYDDSKFYSKPVLEEHEITSDMKLDGDELLVVMGDAVTIGDVPEGVIVDPLLSSTKNAYYKDVSYKSSTSNTSMSQLPSDKTGTYHYAVAVTDDRNENQSRFVYITTQSFAEIEQFESLNTSTNLEFTVRSMAWLAGENEMISIPMKSRTYNKLTYTVDDKTRILVIVVFVIPVAVLSYGGYVWFRRRRK